MSIQEETKYIVVCDECDTVFYSQEGYRSFHSQISAISAAQREGWEGSYSTTYCPSCVDGDM